MNSSFIPASCRTRTMDVKFNLSTTGVRRYRPTTSTVYQRNLWSSSSKEAGNDDSFECYEQRRKDWDKWKASQEGGQKNIKLLDPTEIYKKDAYAYPNDQEDNDSENKNVRRKGKFSRESRKIRQSSVMLNDPTLDLTDESNVDDDDIESDKEYVRILRSPIKKICRLKVDNVSKRNFGTYDPVHPRLPKSTEFRSHLPLKVQSRRVIYKGVSSEHQIEQRRKYGCKKPSWRKELNQKFDFRYGEFYEGGGEYSKWKWERVETERFSHERKTHSNEDFADYNRRHVSNHTIHRKDSDHYNSISGSWKKEDLLQRQNMFGKKWYEVDNSQQTLENDDRDSIFLGSPRGCPEWKLSRGSEQNYSEDNGMTNATASNVATGGYFHASSAKASYNNGLYQSSESKVSADEGQLSDGNISRPNSPISPGYRSKNGNLDLNLSEKGQYELGRNEGLFDDKIHQLGYFYTLKLRPTEEKFGVKYFGFELEFWPLDDPVMKEVVFGYEMPELELARDSIFAAGLAKLSNVNRNAQNQISGLQQQLVYPFSKYNVTTQESSFVNDTPSSKQVPVVSFRAAETETNTRPAPQVSEQGSCKAVTNCETLPQQEYSSVNSWSSYQALNASRSHEATDKILLQGYSSVNTTTTGETKPEVYTKKKDDGNFRIAIPRAPSLIEEQMRRTKSDYRPGIGWTAVPIRSRRH